MSGLSRRRFLRIAAAAGAAGGAAAAAGGLGWSAPAAARGRVSWRGVSLGAEAHILIDHAERDEADDCLAACRQEIERLESLFSLHRPDSALSRLNRDGRLDAPDADFVQLLSIAATLHEASDGAFDPSVQPLWEALARRHTGATHGAAAAADQADAHARTGFDAVRFDAAGVAFVKPQMALTLNGIAQGYITDRVADLLRARGFRHVLVDLGEIRAVGAQGDGSTWPVRISGGDRIVSLQGRALATSATLGTTFDAAGRIGHILDPRAGGAMSTEHQITVSAPTAALADGLSTALCALPQDAAPDLVRAFAGVRLEYAGA